MRRLPRLIFGALIAMAVGLFAVQGVDATSVNFTSVTNAVVEFVGNSDTFRMVDSGGGDTGATRDFSIGSISGGGFASLVGLLGNINGTFTIGPITTVGPVQTAPVSGPGILSINDGAASLTAALDWVDILTVSATGAVNASGTVNLSNFVYAGSNVDLMALAGFPGGIVTASFSFIPSQNLTALTTDGTTNSTGYSGSLSPVPEPTTMFLGGTGLVWLAYAARRRLFGR